MKKIAVLLLTVILISSCLCIRSNAASYRVVPISVNSEKINEFSGYLISNTTFVPFEDFYECDKITSAEVTFNKAAKTAKAVVDKINIIAKSGQKYITVSGKRVKSNVSNRIIDGKLFVPIRSVADTVDIKVVWYSKSRSVDLIIEKQTEDEQNVNTGFPVYNETNLYWLSRIIHSEADGQPFDGKIAVGNVVMNRVRCKDYPDNIHDVIFDRKYGVQFAPTINGAIYNDPDEESIEAAKKVLDGYALSDKILYFVNHDLSSSQWFYTRTFVFKIGDHSFYY